MGAGKAVAIVGVSLVVLGGAAYVGDGFARSYVQGRVAQELQAGLNLPEAPTVELGGMPFSTVFVTRRLPTATLSAEVLPLEVSDQQITVNKVKIDAQQVTIGEQVAIGYGRAEGVVGYPALTQLAGVPVEAGSDPGRVRASYTAELFGQELVAMVSAVPLLNDERDRLLLDQPQIQVAGFPLSDEIAQWIVDEVVTPIRLELPYGLTPAAVSAGNEGVTVAVTAENYVIPQG